MLVSMMLLLRIFPEISEIYQSKRRSDAEKSGPWMISPLVRVQVKALVWIGLESGIPQEEVLLYPHFFPDQVLAHEQMVFTCICPGCGGFTSSHDDILRLASAKCVGPLVSIVSERLEYTPLSSHRSLLLYTMFYSPSPS